MKILYFKTPSEFRKWLEENHLKQSELWVGFYKRESGKPSITWPESVDEALCFGWIDGIRKSVDGSAYKIRFTPRKPKSRWSAVNIKRVQVLTETKRMHPAGLKAFESRDESRSGYSYEQRKQNLDEPYAKKFRANKRAWDFFQSQAPWYQRTTIHWVTSAKKEETRLKRLQILVNDSAQRRRIGPLERNEKKSKE
jgi:uncharacterized protein YdeI (YjbR/CyaY-like superfamily)